LEHTASVVGHATPVYQEICITTLRGDADFQSALQSANLVKNGMFQEVDGDWRYWRRGARIVRMMPGARGNGRYGLSACRSDRGYLPGL
jgi:hypothetical protein